MPRRPANPDCTAVREAFEKLGSITAVAGSFGVTFTTAKKWIRRCGLEEALNSEDHRMRLKQLESEAPTRARRSRVDRELEENLADVGDRKLLARAIVDEFSMRYVFKKCFSWERYVLKLTLVMYDFPPVEEIGRLTGVPIRTIFRKAKSGVRVPCWLVVAEGYRPLKLLQLTRPYMTGQKAFQADIALQKGAIATERILLKKDEYRRAMLASLGLEVL